jgi:hypothetical protein
MTIIEIRPFRNGWQVYAFCSLRLSVKKSLKLGIFRRVPLTALFQNLHQRLSVVEKVVRKGWYEKIRAQPFEVSFQRTNMISVMLIASSIIDKKWPRRGWRQEHRAMDSRRRTRRKSPNPSLGRLDLFSWYFLKNSKIDISQTRDISRAMLWRSTQHVSAVDRNGRTIWIVDAHRDNGKRLIVRADEELTAFVGLESATSRSRSLEKRTSVVLP